MIIRIQAEQVPDFWEMIKYACVNAQHVREEDTKRFLNNLLVDLLAGDSQCFLGFERNDGVDSVTMISVTHAIADFITKKRVLYIDCLYSFEQQKSGSLEEMMELMKKLCKKLECNKIVIYSANPTIFNVVNSLGFKESFREYSLEV